jgi:hypothetical protein
MNFNEQEIVAKLKTRPGQHFKASNGVILMYSYGSSPMLLASEGTDEWTNVTKVVAAIEELLAS